MSSLTSPPDFNPLGYVHDWTPSLSKLTNTMGYVFALLAFAAFFQYWIYRKPDTLLAKILKYFLYLIGIFFLVVCLLSPMGWKEGTGYYLHVALLAFFYGAIFSSYVVMTHHLFKYKKVTKWLFIKILIALIAFQILVPLEMKLQLFGT